MELKKLNEKFGITDELEFIQGKGDFVYINIHNAHAKCLISLYGAHIMSYEPKGQKDVLWMSPQSMFEAGKPVRGGIPVCFPWFGPHPEDNQKPMHGFARLNNWEVVKTNSLVTGDTELVLQFKSNPDTITLWPFHFTAELIIKAGKKLDVTLKYTNNSSETFAVSDALHSYFNISNVKHIGISGLNEHQYYNGFAPEPDNKQTEEILKIEKEENRRYINHTDDCIINDFGWNRKIRVAKKGSKITVVWNPWEATSKTIGDLPDEGYQSFICVEAVNAYNNLAIVKPGESYSIATIINIE